MAFPNLDFCFRRGNKKNLHNAPIKNGSLNFAIDTQEMFVDIDNTRTQISSIEINKRTEAAIKEISNPGEKLYLASDTHRLLWYDFENESWEYVVGYNGAVTTPNTTESTDPNNENDSTNTDPVEDPNTTTEPTDPINGTGNEETETGSETTPEEPSDTPSNPTIGGGTEVPSEDELEEEEEDNTTTGEDVLGTNEDGTGGTTNTSGGGGVEVPSEDEIEEDEEVYAGNGM